MESLILRGALVINLSKIIFEEILCLWVKYCIFNDWFELLGPFELNNEIGRIGLKIPEYFVDYSEKKNSLAANVLMCVFLDV